MKSKVVQPSDLPRHVFSTEETARMAAAGIATGVAEEAARFTLDDVFEMLRVGALDPDAKVELIDGELVQMSPQNSPHMEAKRYLIRRFTLELPQDVSFHVEGTLRLAPDSAPSPDFFFHRTTLDPEQVRAADVLWLLEVAESSLSRDLRAKAALYARFGVADYWVIDASRRRVFIHRRPEQGQYREVTEVTGDQTASPLAFPDFVLAAVDLPGA